MKKIWQRRGAPLGFLLVLALGLLTLGGCGARETTEDAVGLGKVWPESDGELTAMLSDPSLPDQQYEMTAEDTEAAAELFQGVADVKEDTYAAIFPHRIEFSNGMVLEFDNEDYNCYNGDKQYCGYLTTEEGDALMELVAHYTEARPAERPAYELSGDPITLYYHTDSGWQKMDLRGQAAKSVETILNIEELELCHESECEILYYLDFHNGTALTVYTDGAGTVSSGVDSAIYDEWILDGDDPTITFDPALNLTRLPEGTIETIEEAMGAAVS